MEGDGGCNGQGYEEFGGGINSQDYGADGSHRWNEQWHAGGDALCYIGGRAWRQQCWDVGWVG